VSGPAVVGPESGREIVRWRDKLKAFLKQVLLVVFNKFLETIISSVQFTELPQMAGANQPFYMPLTWPIGHVHSAITKPKVKCRG
jgi:hypothetical protein